MQFNWSFNAPDVLRNHFQQRVEANENGFIQDDEVILEQNHFH